MLLMEFQTYLVLKLLKAKSVIYLSACYTSITPCKYFKIIYSVYFCIIPYNPICFISTEYVYISKYYELNSCLSMSCHHTKDQNGNKVLPFFMLSLVLGALHCHSIYIYIYKYSILYYLSVNCIFCYVCFPKPK